MSGLKFSGVRARLMLLVLLAALPAFGLLLHDSHRRGKQAVHDAQQAADALVHHIEMDYERVVAGTRQLLRILARLGETRQQNPVACNKIFANLHAGHSYYANLGAVRPDGVVFCSATPVKGAVNVSDRAYFQNAVATRDFSFGDYQIGRITGKPVLVSSYPSYDGAGKLQSVVFAALDLNLINQIAASVAPPPGSTVNVLDSRGTILNRYPEPEKWIGKSRADTLLVRAILANREGGAAEDTGLDGVRRLYTYAPLADSGQGGRIYIVVGVPRDAIFAETRRAMFHTVATLAAVTVLALMIAWFGGDYFLLKKIFALTETARRLARGERARTGVSAARDEIGLLARTFDGMADTIEAREAEIQRTNEMLERIFSTTHIQIAYLDTDFNFIRVNRAYAEDDGHTPEFFPGKNHFALYPNAENEAIFRRAVETGVPHVAYARPFVFQEHPERGTTYWDWTLHPVRDTGGKVTGLIFCLINVTDRIQAQERIQYLAYHDELTGLPNRALLLDHIQQAVIEARRHGRQVAVICLDIDRFKFVNETHGLTAGDAVLKAAAARLSACLRPGDTVARLGGDEFAIELSDVAHADDVGKVMQKIIACANQPLSVAGNDLFVTMSAGIALYPLDSEDPEMLLKNASVAMYQAKQKGGSNCQFYSAQMAAEAAEHLALENNLRRALERREFTLHYQPQVNLRTGKITGVEALIRWQHPEKGLIPPMRFIPLAEETGLITPIGEWVLEAACAQNRAWQEAGLPPIRIAVNISAQQFRQPGLEETVRRTLQKTGLDPHWLEIELTESILVQNPEIISGILNNLEQLGVQISVDDFGTGYSSLSYLKRFPVDVLKIDQSFVRDIATGPDDAAIVMAIISMAHALGIQTVAEGVETKEQLKFLDKHGCDAMQGYYFCKPLPAGDVTALLRENRRLEPAREQTGATTTRKRRAKPGQATD